MPAVRVPPLVRIADCKTKEGAKGNACFPFGPSLCDTSSGGETLTVGKMGRRGRGGAATGREQIKFPPGNTAVAERETEKGRLGSLPA